MHGLDRRKGVAALVPAAAAAALIALTLVQPGTRNVLVPRARRPARSTGPSRSASPVERFRRSIPTPSRQPRSGRSSRCSTTA